MTQKIRSQASRFWNTVASADTANAYKQAIDVTLRIIKEAAVLVWLVLCLTLVIFDWGTERAIAAGRGTRTWISTLGESDSTQLAEGAKQKLLTASKASVTATISQARQQLGLPEKAESTDVTPVTTKNPPESTGTAGGPPQPSASAAPATPPTATATPSSSAPASASDPTASVSRPDASTSDS